MRPAGTAVLSFDSLAADNYVLQVGTGVESAQGLPLAQAYSSDFTAIADFSPEIDIHFMNGRADADPSDLHLRCHPDQQHRLQPPDAGDPVLRQPEPRRNRAGGGRRAARHRGVVAGPEQPVPQRNLPGWSDQRPPHRDLRRSLRAAHLLPVQRPGLAARRMLRRSSTRRPSRRDRWAWPISIKWPLTTSTTPPSATCSTADLRE